MRSNSIPEKFAQRDVSRFRLLGRPLLTVKTNQSEIIFYRIMHFISFVLIYSLWLMHLRQRENIFFREGHPRRYTVTLNISKQLHNVWFRRHRPVQGHDTHDTGSTNYKL